MGEVVPPPPPPTLKRIFSVICDFIFRHVVRARGWKFDSTERVRFYSDIGCVPASQDLASVAFHGCLGISSGARLHYSRKYARDFY
jgi:hypothetical protein